MIENKVALITGSGAKRVGHSVAEAFADRGYTLVIHYRTSADEARESVARFQADGTDAIALGADLADEAAVKELIKNALAQFGRIDVLVNTAAVFPSKSLEETTAADVCSAFEANTLGTFLICQHVGLRMVTQEQGGCIVTIGDWAIERPYTNYAAYFASKGAIPTLTRMFAVELGTRNPKVRVNCIHPGPVMLPDEMSEDERQAVIWATLLQREGSASNVASAALMLAENDFVTGSCLNVDGGRTVWAGSN